MIVLAVDPGLTGAIALTNGTWIKIIDMPTVSVVRNGKKKRDIDYAKLGNEIISFGTPGKAYVEKVGTMPGQGVSSQGAFMKATGAVLGALGAIGWEIVEVIPQRWKKYHNLIGTEKGAARETAKRLFPEQAYLFDRVRDSGRADAALIGLWGVNNAAT